VNSIMRGLVVGVVSLSLLGISGCSTDNETEAEKLSKNMGDPGKRSETEKKVESANLPLPRSQKEAYERRVDPGKQMGPNYPLAEKKK